MRTGRANFKTGRTPGGKQPVAAFSFINSGHFAFKSNYDYLVRSQREKLNMKPRIFRENKINLVRGYRFTASDRDA